MTFFEVLITKASAILFPVFIWGPLPFTRRGLEGGLKAGSGGLQGGASRGDFTGGLQGEA